MPDKSELLLGCAPITEKPGMDRAMRVAINHARHGKKAATFGHQQAFDAAIAKLVRDIPVDEQLAEWFANENLIPVVRRGWKKIVRNPVVIAIASALLVIGAVTTYRVYEHLNDFPGADKARRLLTVAASNRSVLLDIPLQTTAGALSDLFFMKHRLEHYDVPAEFADFKTLGTRVFDDDEVRRVAQIWAKEKRMQFFLFPAEPDKEGKINDFSDWRFVELEGWTGAVTQRNGVCFMAVIRGGEKDLRTYLEKKKQ
jgi:hypothetical protein